MQAVQAVDPELQTGGDPDRGQRHGVSADGDKGHEETGSA